MKIIKGSEKDISSLGHSFYYPIMI